MTVAVSVTAGRAVVSVENEVAVLVEVAVTVLVTVVALEVALGVEAVVDVVLVLAVVVEVEVEAEVDELVGGGSIVKPMLTVFTPSLTESA